MSRENFFLLIIITLSVFGILDAGYLTFSHYSQSPLLCGPSDSCATVTGSKFSTVFGVPVALFGLLFYLTELVVAFFFFGYRWRVLIPVMTLLAIGGVTASAWFFYVQAAILNAFCFYCLVSAVLSILIAVFSGLFEREVFNSGSATEALP